MYSSINQEEYRAIALKEYAKQYIAECMLLCIAERLLDANKRSAGLPIMVREKASGEIME